jgi:predicted acyl esterase
VPVTLTLYPTSNLFMPGHRIRLDVSSSNFPRFDVNPNTGEAIGHTVLHEWGRESRVAYERDGQSPAGDLVRSGRVMRWAAGKSDVSRLLLKRLRGPNHTPRVRGG